MLRVCADRWEWARFYDVVAVDDDIADEKKSR